MVLFRLVDCHHSGGITLNRTILCYVNRKEKESCQALNEGSMRYEYLLYISEIESSCTLGPSESPKLLNQQGRTSSERLSSLSCFHASQQPRLGCAISYGLENSDQKGRL